VCGGGRPRLGQQEKRIATDGLCRAGRTIPRRPRPLAREHQIPIVKDIPLARLLHKKCEIGREVPMETFKAVAAVLAHFRSPADAMP
jgi:type III secretion system FlhB-like substrate exporter